MGLAPGAQEQGTVGIHPLDDPLHLSCDPGAPESHPSAPHSEGFEPAVQGSAKALVSESVDLFLEVLEQPLCETHPADGLAPGDPQAGGDGSQFFWKFLYSYHLMIDKLTLTFN